MVVIDIINLVLRIVIIMGFFSMVFSLKAIKNNKEVELKNYLIYKSLGIYKVYVRNLPGDIVEIRYPCVHISQSEVVRKYDNSIFSFYGEEGLVKLDCDQNITMFNKSLGVLTFKIPKEYNGNSSFEFHQEFNGKLENFIIRPTIPVTNVFYKTLQIAKPFLKEENLSNRLK